jgi:ABC-type transport system involved in multi-copper enzyme maturation permease subunit
MNLVTRIGRLLRVETQKVLGGRTLKIGLLAVAAVTALTAWTHEPLEQETGWTVLATALAAGLWAAEIFLLVAGTTAIAGETGQGTLKMILPHAYRRSDWIVAKALILAAQACVMLAVAVGVAWAFAKFGLGLGDVTQKDEFSFDAIPKITVLRSAGEMGGFFLDSTGAALGSLIATAWVGLLISCVFDSVVPALSSGFLLFLGVKSAGALFGASPELMKKIYATYPGEMLTRVEKLGRGLAEMWSPTMGARGLLLAAIVGVASVLLGLAIFSRRDLQS